MDMAHPGEEALRESLRHARRAAVRRDRWRAFRNWWSKWFPKDAGGARDLETLAHLKRQLAEARHERDTARDELALLKMRLSTGKEQVGQILDAFSPDDVAEAVSKARAYDELSVQLPTLAGWVGALSNVSDRLILRSVVREMHGELSAARDGFQKIKIYRKYLGRLAAFPQLESILAPFLVDRNLVKDRKRVEGLVEELRRATDVAQDLEPLLSDADSLLRLSEALRPWTGRGPGSNPHPSPTNQTTGPDGAR